ncbi:MULTISPECIES: replication initiation negative regulator SeqA [Basfia]|uniref:Negative modulator of initiation of replication n=2 Tax=Basfia TaxID=697331 RepID=SEQA_MANSM|nr:MULTISPECIES: replication initiation negative regulator SeqA [Basfia]Q65U90.2 RecName: Full=Negative modulator of initiation of replication [[Mannheimia] succiniciproducens MBEL55E]QIM68272.1 replication initiation regulator SeqA [Basfia succiniciproducens]SCX74791.1 negative regulator of replication initiation SeqA [Basfia succiniciproducens]
MKIIEVDEELYQYIASQTKSIGESASDILRRLLNLPVSGVNLTAVDLTQSTMNSTNEEKGTQLPAEKNVVAETPKPSSEQEIRTPARKQSTQSIQHIVTKVKNLLQSEAFQEESKMVVRFLNILSVLYRTNPESFAQATEQETSQGRTRTYYARDEATLLAAGNHTKPRQIPDTPYWVITNTNSGRKMLMLERTMQFMELPEELIDEVRPYFAVV